MVIFNEKINLDEELKKLDKLREECALYAKKLMRGEIPVNSNTETKVNEICKKYQDQMDLVFVEEEA